MHAAAPPTPSLKKKRSSSTQKKWKKMSIQQRARVVWGADKLTPSAPGATQKAAPTAARVAHKRGPLAGPRHRHRARRLGGGFVVENGDAHSVGRRGGTAAAAFLAFAADSRQLDAFERGGTAAEC